MDVQDSNLTMFDLRGDLFANTSQESYEESLEGKLNSLKYMDADSLNNTEFLGFQVKINANYWGFINEMDKELKENFTKATTIYQTYEADY